MDEHGAQRGPVAGREHEDLQGLQFLWDSAVGFLELGPADDVHRYVAERLRLLEPDALVTVTSYDVPAESLRLRQMVGPEEDVRILRELLPGTAEELAYPLSEEARSPLASGRLVEVPGGFHVFTFGAAPLEKCADAERRFGLGRIWSIGFATRGRLLGNVSLVTHGRAELRGRRIVETFASQAAVMLLRDEARRELEHSERRYREMAARLPGVAYQAIHRPDDSLQFAFVSPHVREFVGIEPDEAMNDAAQLIGRVIPEDRPGFERSIAAAVAARAPWHWVGRYRDTAGGLHWAEARSRPQELPDGSVRFDGILLDVTERQRAEEELRRAKEQAEAANRAKTTFLANTSHELRTPMSAVLGMLDLLLGSGLTPDQRECAATARDAGEELLRIVNDLLDLSRIEADRPTLELRPFRLAEQVQAVLRRVELPAREKGITLAAHVADGVPPVLVGDAGRLRQILLNVLENAVKFTPAGSVTVEVDAEPADGGMTRVHFAIRDTGIGIPSDWHTAVFEPFVQVDGSDARRHGGAGLGLAISARLVQRMDGRIWLDSAAGCGCVVHFTLHLGIGDATAEAAVERAGAEGPSSVPPPPPAGGALRVLVAEDNAGNQAVVRRLLEKNGHAATVVPDGAAALRAVHEAPGAWDVLLLDLRMPGLDGFEVASRIRDAERDGGRRLPIVALTAHAAETDRRRCRESGMDDFVSKPIRESELLGALGRAGAGRRERRGKE